MHNGKVEAVVWDLDGTLLESGKLHFEAEKAAFAEYGVHIDEKTYKKYLSTKIEDFVNDVLLEKESEADPKLILDSISRRTIENYSNGIPLTDHAKEVLEIVKSDYKQALATAREKDVAQHAIKENSLDQFFDVEVFAEDVEHGKPNSEVFLIVAEDLHLEPSNMLVVEDGLNGIKAANNANMISVARRAEHNQDVDFAEADYVIDDLRQVLDILKEY